MIEGNFNKRKVYVHKECIVGRLLFAGWPVHIWGDEIPVEVVSSKENCGYWYYQVWVPIPAVMASDGDIYRQALVEMAGWNLFETYQEAIAERLTDKQRRALYKYAQCYHYTKGKKPLFLGRRNPGKWWADLLKGFYLHNFLAKTHQAGTSNPACDDSKQGGAQTLPALPVSKPEAL